MKMAYQISPVKPAIAPLRGKGLTGLTRYASGNQAVQKVVPDDRNGGFHFTGQQVSFNRNIQEDDFQKLNDNAELLCNVIKEKSYRANYERKNYFDNLSEWPEESILRKCGYTVSQTAGLSSPERWKILANVIDHDVLSKIEIQSYIRKQISLHAKYELAIDKWKTDDDFVSGYNKGYYVEYGVVMLKR